MLVKFSVTLRVIWLMPSSARTVRSYSSLETVKSLTEIL